MAKSMNKLLFFAFLSCFLIIMNVSFTSAEVGYNNKGAGASVTNINNFTINGSSAIHNDLTGIQGGNSSEYYHLNLTDWNSIKTNQFLWVTSAGAGDISAVFTLNPFITLNNTASGDVYLNFNGTYLNFTTDSRYFTKAQWNVTNTSYLPIDKWNSTNSSYNEVFINFTNLLAVDCSAGFLVLGVQANGTVLCAADAGNASWNQSYASAELYFTKAQWNVTNSSYLMIDKFNVTNISYRTRDNGTFVINISTISSVLADNLCYANGTNCVAGTGDITAVYNLTKYFWINSSAAGDVYLNFSEAILNETIDNRERTNTSVQVWASIDNSTFRKLVNGTFTTNVSSELSVLGDNLCYTNGTNCPSTSGDITAVFNLSKYFWINSSLTGDVYLNFSETILNETIDNRERTNTTAQVWAIAGNGTLVHSNLNWNTTRDIVPALNNSYDVGNSTNMFNRLWVNTLNIITKIATAQIANSAITAGLIQAGAINATHIGVSAVNTTGILDNTVATIDLASDVNSTMDLRERTNTSVQVWDTIDNSTFRKLTNVTFTGGVNLTNGMNVTNNITLQTEGYSNCLINRTGTAYICHNGTGWLIKG